jgi:SOS-response transcriptional repressor LexA
MQTFSLQCCTEHRLSIPANITFMEGIEEDHRLIVSLVDWASMAPSRVASEIGAAATTITRHYKGTASSRLSRETVLKLRQRFPDYPAWTLRNNNVRSEVAGFGDRPFEEKYGSGELPAIPVLGSAMGIESFDPERDIELTEVDMTEVLDHVRRPTSLSGDSNAYAVTVVGDSMWPRFRPGRRVIVSPRSPISIGDDVIVQLKGRGGEDQDRVALVLIKELVRRSATFIELRQFNPDTTFRVEADRIASVHRVIGEVY